jgi:phage/plasmid-associated DNA primase
MRVQFNAITWYSRLLSYFFVFGVFPALVFFIGKRYQETVMVLSYADESAYQLHSTGTYQATAYAGRGSLKAEQDIVGEWVREDDPKYKIKIKAINTFYDLYKDKVVASGSWLFRDTLPVEVQSSLKEAVSGVPGLFFQKNMLNQRNQESVQYYKVVSLNKDKLVLYFVDTKETVSFIRNISVDESSKTESKDIVPELIEESGTGLLR